MMAGMMSRVAVHPPPRMRRFVFDKGLEQFLERRQQLDAVPPAWTDETVLTGDRWPLREIEARDSLIGDQFSKEPR